MRFDSPLPGPEDEPERGLNFSVPDFFSTRNLDQESYRAHRLVDLLSSPGYQSFAQGEITKNIEKYLEVLFERLTIEQEAQQDVLLSLIYKSLPQMSFPDSVSMTSPSDSLTPAANLDAVHTVVRNSEFVLRLLEQNPRRASRDHALGILSAVGAELEGALSLLLTSSGGEFSVCKVGLGKFARQGSKEAVLKLCETALMFSDDSYFEQHPFSGTQARITSMACGAVEELLPLGVGGISLDSRVRERKPENLVQARILLALEVLRGGTQGELQERVKQMTALLEDGVDELVPANLTSLQEEEMQLLNFSLKNLDLSSPTLRGCVASLLRASKKLCSNSNLNFEGLDRKQVEEMLVESLSSEPLNFELLGLLARVKIKDPCIAERFFDVMDSLPPSAQSKIIPFLMQVAPGHPRTALSCMMALEGDAPLGKHTAKVIDTFEEPQRTRVLARMAQILLTSESSGSKASVVDVIANSRRANQEIALPILSTWEDAPELGAKVIQVLANNPEVYRPYLSKILYMADRAKDRRDKAEYVAGLVELAAPRRRSEDPKVSFAHEAWQDEARDFTLTRELVAEFAPDLAGHLNDFVVASLEEEDNHMIVPELRDAVRGLLAVFGELPAIHSRPCLSSLRRLISGSRDKSTQQLAIGVAGRHFQELSELKDTLIDIADNLFLPNARIAVWALGQMRDKDPRVLDIFRRGVRWAKNEPSYAVECAIGCLSQGARDQEVKDCLGELLSNPNHIARTLYAVGLLKSEAKVLLPQLLRHAYSPHTYSFAELTSLLQTFSWIGIDAAAASVFVDEMVKHPEKKAPLTMSQRASIRKLAAYTSKRINEHG